MTASAPPSRGAVVAMSLSGGKDSTAAAHAASKTWMLPGTCMVPDDNKPTDVPGQQWGIPSAAEHAGCDWVLSTAMRRNDRRRVFCATV